MRKFLQQQSKSARWSALALFLLLASLQMLRAVKDAMAIEAKLDNLQFLITATFLMMIVLTYISGKNLKNSQLILSGLVTLGLLLTITYGRPLPNSPALIFILIGSFSLILISQFWKSLMSINDFQTGLNHYGFIAITGSIGGILGPLASVVMTRYFGIVVAVVFAIVLLFASNLSLYKANHQHSRRIQIPEAADQPAGGTKAMYWIATFIFIYALLSTFIYVKQLEIVSQFTSSIDQRIVLFSIRDAVIGLILVGYQVYTIKQPMRKLKSGIAAFPLITLLLFLIISIIPTLGAVMLAIIIFRSYNYAIVRPARELFYLKTPIIGNMKNSIDTILYRAGDLLAIWLIYLAKLADVRQWILLGIMIPVILVWLFVSTKIQYQIKPIK